MRRWSLSLTCFDEPDQKRDPYNQATQSQFARCVYVPTVQAGQTGYKERRINEDKDAYEAMVEQQATEVRSLHRLIIPTQESDETAV
jgi:hypothetical protein